MGVSLSMIVRRQGAQMADDALRQLAGKMCATLGTNRFSLDPHGEGDDSGIWPRWRRFAHALTISMTASQRSAAIVEHARAYEQEVDKRHAEEMEELAGYPPNAPVFDQDGPLFVGEPSEYFIEVNTLARYSGPDYENLDWLFIRSLARFMGRNLPDGDIWYGGSSSGKLLRRLDAAELQRVDEHYYAGQREGPKPGGLDATETQRIEDHYRARLRLGDSPNLAKGDKLSLTVCRFCGGRPMIDLLSAGSVLYRWCDGCDRREGQILDSAEVVRLPKGMRWPAVLNVATRTFERPEAQGDCA